MKGASEANASESLVAPGIDAMVRERGYITLGEAKRYATSLPRESRRAAGGLAAVTLAHSCRGGADIPQKYHLRKMRFLWDVIQNYKISH